MFSETILRENTSFHKNRVLLPQTISFTLSEQSKTTEVQNISHDLSANLNPVGQSQPAYSPLPLNLLAGFYEDQVIFKLLFDPPSQMHNWEAAD